MALAATACVGVTAGAAVTAGLIRQGRVVIAQSRPEVADVQARMFDLASYFLIKGDRTWQRGREPDRVDRTDQRRGIASDAWVNLEVGFDPEWFPESGIDLGPAQAPPPQRVEQPQEEGMYVRRYAHGLVVVNPGDMRATYRPSRTASQVLPEGGGAVPALGVPPANWRLVRSLVTGALTLAPRHAAVLLYA